MPPFGRGVVVVRSVTVCPGFTRVDVPSVDSEARRGDVADERVELVPGRLAAHLDRDEVRSRAEDADELDASFDRPDRVARRVEQPDVEILVGVHRDPQVALPHDVETVEVERVGSRDRVRPAIPLPIATPGPMSSGWAGLTNA